MTDAELNAAVAKALGWTPSDIPLSEVARFFGCEEWRTTDGALVSRRLPLWATSLDACFRDLVPEARGRGYFLGVDCFDTLGFCAPFFHAGVTDNSTIAETPSRALCLAWLKTKEA